MYMHQQPITSQVAQPHRTVTPSEEALAKVFWSALTTSNGDSVTNHACAHAYRTRVPHTCTAHVYRTRVLIHHSETIQACMG